MAATSREGARPSRREGPGADSLTTEEQQWRTASDGAASAGRWPEAFDQFQKVLESVRSRGAGPLERQLLIEFGTLLRRAGRPELADRIPRYQRRRFD